MSNGEIGNAKKISDGTRLEAAYTNSRLYRRHYVLTRHNWRQALIPPGDDRKNEGRQAMKTTLAGRTHHPFVSSI